MYTYEERMRAIQIYIDSGFRLTRTISQLGYSTHQALRNWYKEYKENGGLHQNLCGMLCLAGGKIIMAKHTNDLRRLLIPFLN